MEKPAQWGRGDPRAAASHRVATFLEGIQDSMALAARSTTLARNCVARIFGMRSLNLGWRKSRSPPSSDRSLGASTVSKPETLTRDDQKGNNTRRVCLSFVEGASVFLFSLGNGKPKEHHHSEGS